MKIFCTYCSADKRHDEALLPAITRYVDRRIDDVYAASNSIKIEFMILSGKYGLLNPSELIPYYDHLLQDSEVTDHSQLVAKQLASAGVTQVTYFTVTLADDPNVEPYLACVKEACLLEGIDLNVVYLPGSYA